MPNPKSEELKEEEEGRLEVKKGVVACLRRFDGYTPQSNVGERERERREKEVRRRCSLMICGGGGIRRLGPIPLQCYSVS